MENEVQLPEEDVVNPEQFQVGRNTEDDQSGDNRDRRNDQDQAGYTPGETEYADGEGTDLDQEIDELEDTEEDPEEDSV